MSLDTDYESAKKRYEMLEAKITKRDAKRLKEFDKIFGVQFEHMTDPQFKAYMRDLYDKLREAFKAQQGGK